MSGDEAETPTQSQTRTSGKGSRNTGTDDSNYRTDTEGDFEDDPDSEQAEDAQGTLDELAAEVEDEDEEGSQSAGAAGGMSAGNAGSVTGESDDEDGDSERISMFGSETADEMENWEPGETPPDDELNDRFEKFQEWRESSGEVSESPDQDLETRIENGEQPSVTAENLDEWQEYRDDFPLDESFFEDGRTPDAPEGLNLDEVDEYRPIDAEEAVTGASADDMFVAEIDGERVFVTVDGPAAAGDPITGTDIADAISESMSEQGGGPKPNFPPLHTDKTRGASVLGDVATDGTDRDDLNANPAYMAVFDEDIDREKYMTAISAKVIAGDTDVGGNVMVRSDGECYPIDFDLAGSDIERGGRAGDDVFERSLGASVESNADTNFSISRDELEEHTQKVADQIDPDALEDALESRDVSERTVENIKGNVEKLQQRKDLEP